MTKQILFISQMANKSYRFAENVAGFLSRLKKRLLVSLGKRNFGLSQTTVMAVKNRRFHGEMEELIADGQYITIDLGYSHEKCGRNCPAHIKKWQDWLYNDFRSVSPLTEFSTNTQSMLRQAVYQSNDFTLVNTPLAIIKVPKNYDDYLQEIGPKSRNMLRKAERSGYVCRELNWNLYLQDIFEINTSKEKRGNKEMSESYKVFPSEIYINDEDFCFIHGIRFLGCFLENKLIAYCTLNFSGDLAIVTRILGHGEHLKYGVMNALIAFIVKESMSLGNVRYINYLTLHSSTPELDGFKKRTGFRPYAVIVPVLDDQEKYLKQNTMIGSILNKLFKK